MVFKFIILGLIQGLTEFLPVSSSGHLVICQRLLGLSGQEVALSVILHIGTLLAILVFFFREILKAFSNARLILLILLATFITGAAGLLGKEFFEGLFSSPRAVALAWFATGLLLLFTKKAMDGKRKEINLKDATVLGFTQAIAIIPGISRSGVTISTLLFRKLDRSASFVLSFIVGLPVILGAGILEAKDIGSVLKGNLLVMAIGFTVSFLSGLLALALLKKVMDKAGFHYFGYYCIAVSLAVFLFIH
ncbi:MAG: undecaprenyl-diphosphate phosphatase [Candidatus Omnitrophica bacterium]|jgi:undecaprenyl-diphosphatase|nr:undecaprenyl-diphosphate phosphatase [Candidatus Omnitrophota bacterium]MDD5079382.1 undecaprenyl-diphosphate phosphatase [Candidatus Omnitrophota bacterium]